jgi:hypothetical protein
MLYIKYSSSVGKDHLPRQLNMLGQSVVLEMGTLLCAADSLQSFLFQNTFA